jgi:hypothetical protein
MPYLRSLFLGFSLTLIALAACAEDGVYDLEMVIFEQPADGDTESFPESPEPPDLRSAAASLNTGRAVGGASGAAPLKLLPLADGRLGPAVYTLNRRGAQVLAHLRWRQLIPRDTENPWDLIREDRVEGLIRLNRGRYIHLDTDLMLNAAGQSYRVQEHARARSGELYYVDHPKLGILFRADRYENPNAAPVEAPQQEPAPQEPTEQPESDNPPEQRAPAGELPRAMPDPT